MKTHQLVHIFILISVFVLSSCAESISDALESASSRSNQDSITHHFTYEGIRDSEQWKSCKSLQQRKDVAQLPKDVLADLSTEELLEICLSHPLIIDCYAFDDYSVGFKAIMEDFNGYQEFISREDATNVAIEHYLNLDYNQIRVIRHFE